MTTTELMNNLNVLLEHFKEKRDNSDTSPEYTENYIAVTTIEEAITRIEHLSNLGYALNYVIRNA